MKVRTVPSREEPHRPGWRAALLGTARALAREERPDLVISEGYWGRGVEQFLKEAGIPLAAFAHNFHVTHFYNKLSEIDGPRAALNYLFKQIPGLTVKFLLHERVFYGACDLVLPVSDFNGGLLKKIYGLAPEKLKTFYNWVDYGFFAPAGENRYADRLEIGAAPGDIVFIIVGSILRPKGFHLALTAFAQALKNDHRLRLIVTGQGADLGYARKVLGEDRALRRVTALGLRNRGTLSRLYKASDAFILPSLISEACSYTMLEAMASGLPVITTRTGANREIPHGSAILTRASVKSVSDAIEALAGAPDRRAALGAQARTVAEKCFSVQAAAARWDEITALLSAPRGGAARCSRA
jgi:glycosyltransferase involved in cell wall biosynthesis